MMMRDERQRRTQMIGGLRLTAYALAADRFVAPFLINHDIRARNVQERYYCRRQWPPVPKGAVGHRALHGIWEKQRFEFQVLVDQGPWTRAIHI